LTAWTITDEDLVAALHAVNRKLITCKLPLVDGVSVGTIRHTTGQKNAKLNMWVEGGK
jgi:hypothetical protein